jgi:CBS domain-containing protein
MLIKNLMQKQVVSCPPSATVHDVAGMMKDRNVGSVLIVEENSLKGIVTDRDIALRLGADSMDPTSTPISRIMTSDPNTISADADIESALQLMSKSNIRRVPVTQDGKLVGLLSSADLAVEIRQELDRFLSLEEAIAK